MDQRGLIVQGRLDLDHEPAVELYAAMKSGRINGLSFAYDILSKRILDNGVTELLELELLEITICIIPMNANAHVLAIKSAAVTPVEKSELERINRELDQLASNERPRSPELARQVDELILETRLELVQESLARAEQVAWDERMDINLVLAPEPVRVDARMRPVSSEDGSPSV